MSTAKTGSSTLTHGQSYTSSSSFSSSSPSSSFSSFPSSSSSLCLYHRKYSEFGCLFPFFFIFCQVIQFMKVFALPLLSFCLPVSSGIKVQEGQECVSFFIRQKEKKKKRNKENEVKRVRRRINYLPNSISWSSVRMKMMLGPLFWVLFEDEGESDSTGEGKRDEVKLGRDAFFSW